MVNQESEIHGLLLSIVVCNEQDRFYMNHQVTHSKHAEEQGQSMLFPALGNVDLLRRVQHEAVFDYISLLQNSDIKLLFENLVEQFDFLRG